MSLTTVQNGMLTSDPSNASNLSSGTVAAARMPTGSVIQTQYCNSSTVSTFSVTETPAEINTSYRVTITPIFSNSLIILHYFVPMSPNGSWTANWIIDYSAVRMPSSAALNTSLSTITSTGPAAGSRRQVAGSMTRSSNGYDNNDSLTWGLTALDLPGSTASISYGFTISGEGGGPIIVNQSQGNNASWGFSARTVIIAQEIKQ